jgi:hypothetical protein
MAGQLLDRLKMGLAVVPESRRLTLGRLVQSGLGALFFPAGLKQAAANKRKKKRKKCKQGHRRCHRKCIPFTACCSGAECGTVPCVAHTCDCAGRTDGTDCGGGKQCSGGVCAKPPTCVDFLDACVDDVDCCGLTCVPFQGSKFCACSPGGRLCHISGDCCGGFSCVGFFCE